MNFISPIISCSINKMWYNRNLEMWIINICPYKARSRMFLPWILHWKGFIGLTNNKNIELCMTRCLMIMDGHEIDFNQWEPRMGWSWPITGLETNSSPIPVDDLVVCMTFDSGSVVAAVPLYKCMFISSFFLPLATVYIQSYNCLNAPCCQICHKT